MRSGVFVCLCLLVASCNTTNGLLKYLEEKKVDVAEVNHDQPTFTDEVNAQPLISELEAFSPEYHYAYAAERRTVLEATNFTSLTLIRNPKISFERRFHDFGVVPAGEKPGHVFKFKNTGDGDLNIKYVTSSRTTKVYWPDHTIKPGEDGYVQVIFDTAGRSGEEEVVVNIVSNTDPEVVEARFRAFIQAR